MPRIVSLTPLAVDRDSRTFKQAAAAARLGYESVVVEGQPSTLDRAGLPFALLTADPGPLGRMRGPIPRAVRWLIAKARNVAWAISPELTRGADYLWRLLTRTTPAVPPASLYYLHSPLQYPAIALRRTPFVYDVHDFYAALWGDGAYGRLLLAVERRCVRRAAELVTAGDGADLLEGRYGRRPAVVRNVHDPRIDDPCVTGLRSALGLGADDFLLVMAGNAKPGTAVEEGIRTIAELPARVHLAFVGAGWESYAGLTRAHGVDQRVHLHPAVPPTQVAPFIASADASLLLYYPATVNHLHALPNCFFLAIAAGLPVLYPAALLHLRRLAEEHGIGLPIDPLQPSSIVAATNRLLDPSKRAELRARVQRARVVLTWEREEERLRESIERALRA